MALMMKIRGEGRKGGRREAGSCGSESEDREGIREDKDTSLINILKQS